MFSFYTENNVQRRTAAQNENNVTARKPTLSARKPLIDRKVNLQQDAAQSVKPKSTPRSVLKEKPVQEDIIIDFCSYKDVPDKYEDLTHPDQFLGEGVVNNIITAFSRKNIPEPEPPVFTFEEPKPTVKKFEFRDFEMLDSDGIAELLKSELELLSDCDESLLLPDNIM